MNSRINRPAMGISTLISSQNKRTYWEFLNTFEAGNLQAIELGVNENFSEVAEINGSHPINEAEPGIGYYSDIIVPIAQSLDGFTRQNYFWDHYRFYFCTYGYWWGGNERTDFKIFWLSNQ